MHGTEWEPVVEHGDDCSQSMKVLFLLKKINETVWIFIAESDVVEM